MIEDNLEQEINISKLFYKAFNFLLRNKAYVLIIIIISKAYSLYMNNKEKPVYRSTAIIDTRDVVEIDVMREIINDFFKDINTSSKSLQNNLKYSVINYKKRDAGKLFPNRLYLDATISINNFKPLEEALVEYINDRKSIHILIEHKKEEYIELIRLINNMDSLNTGVTEETLNVIKNKIKYKRELTQLDNYNPIVNSFSIPTVYINERINLINNFIKVFISGLVLLILFSFLRKKLVKVT